MTLFRFILLFILLPHTAACTDEEAADTGQANEVTRYGSFAASSRIPRAADNERLLKHRAAVEARNREGVTALHNTATMGLVYEVTRLLEHGADVDARTTDGWTPRDLAKNKHKAIIRLLNQATSS